MQQHEVIVNGILYNVEFTREWVRDYSQGYGVDGYDYSFHSVSEFNEEENTWEPVKVDSNLEWRLSEELDEAE